MSQKADLLFTNAIVLTMDEKMQHFEPGAVAIQGDSILAAGLESDLKNQYPDAEIFDCGGKVLMPGLVNAHTHVPMTLLRGLADEEIGTGAVGQGTVAVLIQRGILDRLELNGFRRREPGGGNGVSAS